MGGANASERVRIEDFLKSLDVSRVTKTPKKYPEIQVSGSRIGTDEVGKGDYFGPLVVGGVAADEAQCKQLREIGVKDSKTLSDATISDLAVQICQVLNLRQREIIVIPPEKYNKFHREWGNANSILAWGHARAIENLAEANPICETAIADQFGNKSYIEKALMQKGRELTLVQSPKGEREITVAAASIIARARFVGQMSKMSQAYGINFPKGATVVIPTAALFIQKFGSRALLNVAKVDFKTTHAIPGIDIKELT